MRKTRLFELCAGILVVVMIVVSIITLWYGDAHWEVGAGSLGMLGAVGGLALSIAHAARATDE